MARRTTWSKAPPPWEPVDEWEGDWMGKAPVDMTGRPIRPGDWLVKSFQSGRSSNIEVRMVREVRNGRVYLGDSKVPVTWPGRTLVLCAATVVFVTATE